MISPDRVSFRMLTDKQIAEIHRATLEVLEKTGVRMEHPEAQQLLVGAGCTIGDDDIVRFPADVIERALETSPHHVTVYNRTGTPRMELTDRNVYYGTVTSLPFMADADGTRRPYTLEDCRQMTLIMDYLDSLDFATGTGNCSDVPPEVCDVHEISCMLEHSAKPALITTHDEAGLDAITEICAAYKGGLDGFRQAPFVVYCVCPLTPLHYPQGVLGKMLKSVRSGFPFIAVPAPGAGGTSPVTLAGTLVTGNAEILSALALTQAAEPGSSFIYGGFFTSTDMATMVMTHGSPEFNLMNIAQAEMARNYRLPSFSSAGCTDAHELDVQAGFECGISTFVTALCGANMVHAIGVLGSGTGVNREMLVLNDDLITYTKRMFQAVEVDDQHLALDEIASIGPGGSFLESDLTAELYRQELWMPQRFVRAYFDKWDQAGRPALAQQLAQECDRIVREHEPEPISDDQRQQIQAIIAASDQQRRKDA